MIMSLKFEKLNLFFDRIKTVGFWQRIFDWRQIRTLSYDAYEEFKELESSLGRIALEADQSKNLIAVLNNDIDHLKADKIKLESSLQTINEKCVGIGAELSDSKSLVASKEETIRQSLKKINEQEISITALDGKITNLSSENSQLKKELSDVKSSEASKEETIRQSLKQINEQGISITVLDGKITNFTGENSLLKKELSDVKSSAASKEETIRLSERKINDQEKELAILKERINQLSNEVSQLKQKNTVHEQTEADRKIHYEKEVATLTTITEKIQDERQKEINDRQADEIARLEGMKETWGKHQENVKNIIKTICQKHTIEYIEQVPFKGSPDNTIRICEEFVIFDAKSPSSEDLKNFPLYIKTQTESVKKYIKEDSVRKDIFLVIPSNTVDVIESFSYNMADYNVYIVTIDVLEPLILTLKKIEEYEFVNQLSPEERENICRVIGKFAHMTKRRIQIDHFFARQFLDILTKCETDLPGEILEKVIEFEQSEKLNPPQEKRAKQILTQILETDSGKIQKEAEAKAIIFPTSLQKNLKSIPLYEGEDSG